MILQLKEKYSNTQYWDKAFDVAYKVSEQDLTPKEMCVVAFLKAVEYVQSTNTNNSNNFTDSYLKTLAGL